MGGSTCFARGIAGASLTSLEYIPLTLYKPYGLSLVVWVWSGDLGVEGCKACPWAELYNSRGSFDLVDLDVGAVVSRGKSLGVDILFLHGGEPLHRPWISCLSEEASRSTMPLGVKARLDMLSSSMLEEVLRRGGLEAVLLEVPQKLLGGRGASDAVGALLDLLGRGLYVEVIVTDLGSPLDKRVREQVEGFLNTIGASYSGGDRGPLPIGLYAAHLDEQEIISMRRLLRGACTKDLYCYIVESSRAVYPDYVRCPKCGFEVARRSDMLVIPSTSGPECPSCGSRIFHRAPGRVRRKVPVNTPIKI